MCLIPQHANITCTPLFLYEFPLSMSSIELCVLSNWLLLVLWCPVAPFIQNCIKISAGCTNAYLHSTVEKRQDLAVLSMTGRSMHVRSTPRRSAILASRTPQLRLLESRCPVWLYTKQLFTIFFDGAIYVLNANSFNHFSKVHEPAGGNSKTYDMHTVAYWTSGFYPLPLKRQRSHYLWIRD